jgi:hypothetical protein
MGLNLIQFKLTSFISYNLSPFMSRLIKQIIECGPICGVSVVLFVVVMLVGFILWKQWRNISLAFAISIIVSVLVSIPVYKVIETNWDVWFGGGKSTPIPSPSHFIYDTDSKNNVYIKTNLHPQLLRTLDKVLEKEKENSGLRLTDVDLNKISQYNNEVNEAYNRWRKCKDMMRSNHHVIYPSERRLYFKTGN